MKTWAWGILILIILAILGALVYVARPVSAPSEDIVASAEGLMSDGESTLYRISQSESRVEFNIGEILRDEPFMVVGATDQVAGDIKLNLSNPSLSEVGTIRVNARTLKTDSTNRDGAIARFILKSEDDANEFITFVPTALSSLPSEIKVGEEFGVEITGNLSVSGVTKSVVFSAILVLGEDGNLSGSAETNVMYKDFGLSIPEVPFVASVEDSVLLKIDFTAESVL